MVVLGICAFLLARLLLSKVSQKLHAVSLPLVKLLYHYNGLLLDFKGVASGENKTGSEEGLSPPNLESVRSRWEQLSGRDGGGCGACCTGIPWGGL